MTSINHISEYIRTATEQLEVAYRHAIDANTQLNSVLENKTMLNFVATHPTNVTDEQQKEIELYRDLLSKALDNHKLAQEYLEIAKNQQKNLIQLLYNK